MSDDYMPRIELAISIAEFHRLPRNPAYKYEYFGGRAVLSPRPKYYHAVLDLTPMAIDASIELRPLSLETIGELSDLLAGAFGHQPPFTGFEDEARDKAATTALQRVQEGHDGPVIQAASFTAWEEEECVGLICVTLIPEGDPTDWDSYSWREPPPSDCVECRLGRAHLTWVAVAPLLAGRGWGTAMLAASVRGLLGLGYTQLWSTFVRGNDSSLLWHWRNGFRLLPYPGSYRLMQVRIKEWRKEP